MTVLRTERLVLDAPRESDIDAVYAACQDRLIQQWIPLASPYTRENAEFFVRSYVPHGAASGRFTVWAYRIGDGPLLGVVEVRTDEAEGSASLGCWQAPGARGHGYMREALARVVAHALAPDGMGFARLRWEFLTGNEQSKRLANDLGFAFDPASVHTVDFRGESREAVFGVLRRNPSGDGGPAPL
ncbi:GNAT family protein [Leifsonia lichenia]